MTLTQADARGLVTKMAAVNPLAALESARAITEPWFACQALAWTGRYWPQSDFAKILDEALQTIEQDRDPFRVVAGAAWPIRAFIERGAGERIRNIVPELILRSSEIANMGSRSEALLTLFQAVALAEKDMWRPVLDELVRVSFPFVNWRQPRNLRLVVLMLVNVDNDVAQDVLSGLPDGRLKSQITNRLQTEDSRHHTPRKFFWVNADDLAETGTTTLPA
jgi:hypothetical protein